MRIELNIWSVLSLDSSLSHYSMLYPSQHNPFLHTPPPTTFSSSSSPQKMEALKVESGTAAFAEEFNGSNGDDLFVDELLDFSNGFSEVEEPEEENQPEKKRPTTFSDSVSQEDTKPVVALSDDGQNDAFDPLPHSQITLPAEDLENLEWLSHFVEDSFSDYSLTGKLPPNPVEPASQQPCFTTPVQTKARTKRARTGVRVWPVLSPESSTSSGSSTSSFPQSTLWLSSEPMLGKPVMKKRKKTAEGAVVQPRRCSHCGVTKTPQWRAGPLGSKTLCNACGVRFKSGRLLPEYRPACSPTFSSELHSNNHRKVLEMRRKKETGPDGGEPVPSF